MINLSYNLSPNLKNNLSEIEVLRQKILVQPLSRETETKLRWQARLIQVYFDIAITDNKINKKQLAALLGQVKKTGNFTQDEAEALYLKRAIDYIDHYWYMAQERVTPDTILHLYKIASSRRTPKGFTQKAKLLKQSLDYLQVKTDNPIIQAATAHLEIRLISPFETFNGRLARLTEILFLYKNGMDFRGLLTLNEFWYENKLEYQKIIAEVEVSKNMTMWLEFFTRGFIMQLTKALKATHQAKSITAYQTDSYWRLTTRQKEILIALEVPNSSITNRQVQKLFDVSQITAARDLGKLTSLNMILRHGRGRSIFYEKV